MVENDINLRRGRGLTLLLTLFGFLCLCWKSDLAATPLDEAAGRLAVQVSDSLDSGADKRKLVVAPLTTSQGVCSPLGELVAEELKKELYLLRNGRFEVLDTPDWTEVKFRHELSKASSPSSSLDFLLKQGRVDSMLMGTVAEFDTVLVVIVRWVDLASSEIRAVGRAEIIKADVSLELLRGCRE